MIGKLTGIQRLFGGEWVLSFTTKGDAGTVYDKLHDVDVSVEIKKYNPKRSKDANAFCWALCTDIGNAMTPPLPKEEVYRKAIREVGEYDRSRSGRMPWKPSRGGGRRTVWAGSLK